MPDRKRASLLPALLLGLCVLLLAAVLPSVSSRAKTHETHETHMPLSVDEPQWGPDIPVNAPLSDTYGIHKQFSLAIDPTNPDDVIAGYDSYREGPGESGYSWSTDAGRSWAGGRFTGPWYGTEEMRPSGDTHVGFDARGVGYYT